jgi:hypothetical protein
MFVGYDDRLNYAFRFDSGNCKFHHYTPNFGFHRFDVVQKVYINLSRHFQTSLKNKLWFFVNLKLLTFLIDILLCSYKLC